MNLKHIGASATAPRVLPPSSREHSHIGHRRSVWSDQRLASTLESFHLPRLTCCCHGTAPQASLKVFQFFTLFFSLTSLPLWFCCGLRLSLSLSEIRLSLSLYLILSLFELKFNKLALQLHLYFINYNFINFAPVLTLLRWWVCLLVYCNLWIYIGSRSDSCLLLGLSF